MVGSIKLWIGISFSLAFLALFLLTVDLGRMIDSIAGANYVLLIPAVGLYLVSVLFRTFRWQVLLRHMRHVSVRRLYPVVVIGYMANNLLPVRLGEVVRSYYIGEREGISKASALVTILVERVLDALTLLFFIAVIAIFVPLSGLAEGLAESTSIAWPFLVVGLSAPFVIAFATLLLFAAFPANTRAVAFALLGPLPERFVAPGRDLVDYFLHGLIPLRSPRTLGGLLLLSLPIWLFEASLFFMIGISFGLQDSFANLGQMAVAMVLVTAISNIGSSVPGAPGGIGLFEIIARETLVLLPLAVVDRSVAAGFAAVSHVALLLPMIVLGQLFLWTGHISLGRLFRGGKTTDLPHSQEAGSLAQPLAED